MSLRDNDTEGTIFGSPEDVRAKLKTHPRATHEAAAKLRTKIERDEARKAAKNSDVKAS